MRVSDDNSTYTPLNAGQTFTGIADKDSEYPDLKIDLETDQIGILTISLSQDNTNFISREYVYDPNNEEGELFKPYVEIKGHNYVRVSFKNTSDTNQTFLRLHTEFGTFRTTQTIQKVELTRSTTVDGDVITSKNRAFIQSVPSYNFIPSNFRTFTDGASGSATAENGMFKVSCGTGGLGSFGAIQSFRSLNYKAGETGMTRFTARFDSSSANSWQGVGLLNIGDELSFGYNGTDFGCWHRYGGKAEVRTITVTNPATGGETLTLTLNNVAYSIPLTAGTVQHNAYEIEQWLKDSTNQTIWGADQINDTVIINALSDGPKSNTYSFSSSGTATGTITLNETGVTKTSDFVKQTEWNRDQLTNLDPSKLNIYEIRYQITGNISYYVEDPDDGFILVHIINTQGSTPNFNNPSLRSGLYSTSVGSTTNHDVYAGSLASFVQGNLVETRNPRALVNSQSCGTSPTTIFVLRNRRTYNSQINQVEIEPRELNISSESSKNVEIELRASTNFNTSGDQNFQNIGSNLISDASVNANTISGSSRLLGAFTVSPSSSLIINLKNEKIRIPPSLQLAVLGKVTSGSSAVITASLVYYEDV